MMRAFTERLFQAKPNFSRTYQSLWWVEGQQNVFISKYQKELSEGLNKDGFEILMESLLYTQKCVAFCKIVGWK